MKDFNYAMLVDTHNNDISEPFKNMLHRFLGCYIEDTLDPSQPWGNDTELQDNCIRTSLANLVSPEGFEQFKLWYIAELIGSEVNELQYVGAMIEAAKKHFEDYFPKVERFIGTREEIDKILRERCRVLGEEFKENKRDGTLWANNEIVVLKIENNKVVTKLY